jgi:peroxiredoxin
MMPLGTMAPDFNLPDTDGNNVSLDALMNGTAPGGQTRDPGAGERVSPGRNAPALLVIFLCNHCPYVKHVRHELARLGREYQGRGVAVVGISSNDVATYPDDSPEKMRQEKAEVGYTFPYLYDETQEVAQAYQAACTPDFFLFDGDRRLIYRGQLDDSRPGNPIPVTGKDLRAALDAVLAGTPVAEKQRPSMGCNIKWKPGREPRYAG